MIPIAQIIKNKIEHEVNFPGVININLIRETRTKIKATKESIILGDSDE